MSVSLIKLKNGTEIIGQIVQLNEKVILEDPMQINYKYAEATSLPVVSFSRYCPFSIENIFQFDMTDVLHLTPVKKAVEDYYLHAITNYKNTSEKYIDEEFSNAIDPKSSLENEMFRKYLQKVKIDGYAQ
jgi:hypothetical protein